MSIGQGVYPILTPPQMIGEQMRGQILNNNQASLANLAQMIGLNYMPQQLQQEAAARQYANQIQQAQANVAPQMAEAGLTNTQLQAPYMRALTSAIPSEINLRNMQASGIPSEIAQRQAATDQIRFMLKNPAYIAGGPPAQIAAIADLMKSNPAFFGSANQQNVPGQTDVLPNGTQVRQLPGGLNANQGQNISNQLGQIFPNVNSGQQPQFPFAAQQQGMPQGQPQFSTQSQPQGQPQAQSIGQKMLGSALAQLNAPAVKNERTQQLISGAPFLNADAASKAYMTGQATSFGLDPSEANKQLISGKTLADIAESKGFGRDPAGWPEPDYAATSQTRSRNQARQSAVSELNAVEEPVAKALGPYSQTIRNYSPKQVIDSFNTLHANTPEGLQKKNAMSDFLAAASVSQDLALVRARGMGMTNIGIESLNKILNGTMTNFKSFQSLVPPDVYVDTQRKIGNYVRQMSKAATKAVYVPLGVKGDIGNPFAQNNQNQAPQNIGSQGTVVMVTPDGRKMSIPESNVSAAMKLGAKRADNG